MEREASSPLPYPRRDNMAKEKILVVEDNQFNLELIVNILQVRGYEICTATTGKEAIELAKKELPDLILMDIQLPVIDGYEATRKIKEDPKCKRIPIVAITSYAMKEDKEKILESGCDGYIVKPIDTRELPKTVAKFLQNFKKEDD